MTQKQSARQRARYDDPEQRRLTSEAVKRAWQDPAKRAEQQALVLRAHARKAVKAAGLPLLRRTVDRARQLLDENGDLKERGEVVVDALRLEFGRAA